MVPHDCEYRHSWAGFPALENTLTELKEVSCVKFLIDGAEVEELKNPFAKI